MLPGCLTAVAMVRFGIPLDEHRMSLFQTAFLYPGQGSQRVGMGTELQRHAPDLFERYLGAADEVSGQRIRYSSTEGSIDDLTDTRVTQPALFALSLALTEHARSAGLLPDMVAGHSLGEYTAAVAVGALSFEDGLRLVCARARLMADVQHARPGAMAMVAGLDTREIERLCASTSLGKVVLANLNAPAQMVVSGDRAAVEQLVEFAKAAGASETLMLNVDVAAHSEHMHSVAESLAGFAETCSWHEPQMPMVSNVSGELLTSAESVHDALLAQLTRPVQWVRCVERLRAAGTTRFLELGPGRVLSGLVRQIIPDANTYASASPRRLATLTSPAGAAGS